MGGFIRKREVLSNPLTVIRAFGFRVFLACLLAKGNTPFLSILAQYGKV